MIGTQVRNLLEEYNWIDARESGVDLLDSGNLKKWIAESKADTIVHMAGYTDVKAAEKETGNPVKRS